MKVRMDFVTNSSSSSFIITNKTDKVINGIDIASYMIDAFEEWKNNSWGSNKEEKIEDFIESANAENISINPNDSYLIDCGDHREDGIFENVIHYIDDFDNDKISIKFHRSYH